MGMFGAIPTVNLDASNGFRYRSQAWRVLYALWRFPSHAMGDIARARLSFSIFLNCICCRSPLVFASDERWSAVQYLIDGLTGERVP